MIRSNELGHAVAETLGDKPIVLLQAMAIGGGQVTYLEPEEAEKASAQDGFERAWIYWKIQICW